MTIQPRRLPGVDLPRALEYRGNDHDVVVLRDAIEQNFRELLVRTNTQLKDQATTDAKIASLETTVPLHHATHELGGTDEVLVDWSQIVTGKPTTLAGYAITDAYTKTEADARYAPLAHTHHLVDVLDFGADGGYVRSNGVAWVRVSGVAWADVTGAPSFSTSLAALTDVSLTSLADKDLLQYDSGSSKWVNRTVAASLAAWPGSAAITTVGTLSAGAVPYSLLTGTVPTWNQNTTGSAAKWTTARNLAGNSVDGSGNVAFANKFIVQGTTDAGLSGAQFLGALSTGIVLNTTTTGVLSIAVAGDFPTLNQNTTGSAATLLNTRTIWGQNFNGSGNVTGNLTLATTNRLNWNAGGTTYLFESAVNNVDFVVEGASPLTVLNTGVRSNLLFTSTGVATFATDIVFSGANGLIRANTADGSDSKTFTFASGGAAASSRGAFVGMAGNEATSIGGELDLVAGNTSTGHIFFYTGNTVERARFQAAGGLLMSTDLTFTDATYDIGKSGAMRPRDGFFSRNLTVGGDVQLATSSKLYVDGATHTSYFHQLAPGEIRFVCLGLAPMTFVGGDSYVGGKLYFRYNTATAYMAQNGDDRIDATTSGGLAWYFTSSIFGINRPLDFVLNNTYDLGATNAPRDVFVGRHLTIGGKFGCNGATAQAAAASGGALAAYATGAFGLDSDAHMHALFDLVGTMRTALVANGIMS